MSDEFKSRLIQHARVAGERAARATSEAATSQYLVLPFFQLLGYDPLNPDEVVPEAHASFSDKFKNRVDYAICKDGQPVIGVECKKVGALNDGHRGELKGYFNAVPSIKLGVLTDGLIWQFFSDTGRENMMDDEPFTVIDLREVADGKLADHQLDALVRLRREAFDPQNVGADARRKLHVSAYIVVLERAFLAPDEQIVRTLMDSAKIDGRRTGRLVEEHAPVVREAMQAFLDKKILERVGFAERGDLVRVPAPAAGVVLPAGVQTPASVTADAPATATVAAGSAGTQPAVQGVEPTGGIGDGVVTTHTEIAVFEYVRRRLPFLIERDEALYGKLEHLYPRDFKTRFTVCYKQDRNGRLFNFTEMAQGPKYRFEFPDTGAVINTDSFRDIDEELLAAFLKRVAELG
jgi:predicted type IV restriction endonuclease